MSSIPQPLLAHQRGDIEFITRHRRVLLANEPGCGKSRSAIEATADAKRVLVVAPKMVIVGGTWRDEIRKWAPDPSVYTVAPYTGLNAREKTGGSGNRPTHRVRPEFQGPWDAVIVDEAHYIKGRNTSWTWAVEQLTKPADRVVLMTGTPIPNWANELFTSLRVLYPGEARRNHKFGSFWRWAETWFDCSPTRFSGGNPVVGAELLKCGEFCHQYPTWDPCEHYKEFVRANLGDRCRKVLRDTVLDLPPLTEMSIETPLTAAERKVYKQLAKDFCAQITDGGDMAVAWSTGALNVMLDQLTTSPWLLAPEGPARGGKLDRLKHDLASRSRPTLVLAHYRKSVEACAEVARSVGASVEYVHGGTNSRADAAAVERFKAGELDVLCASLETIAEGLTLTAADMVIFVETSFKPYRNQQAKYRVHRIGQTRPVTALNYVTPDTVDARKRVLLETKTDRQMRYLSQMDYAALL